MKVKGCIQGVVKLDEQWVFKAMQKCNKKFEADFDAILSQLGFVLGPNLGLSSCVPRA